MFAINLGFEIFQSLGEMALRSLHSWRHTAVVMYGAGGGTDTIIRTLAREMAASTGWTINVINKPGAVGGVATRFLLNKPNNGYWWLGAANYNKFVRVMGHSDSKAWEDWQYFQAANSIASWSVRPDSPYKTFEDVVAAAKANPGKISISTSGTGGLWQEIWKYNPFPLK